MKHFYCFGKKGICEHHKKCDGCPYMDGNRGEEIEVDENELKPCPFCGGAAKIQIVEKGVKSIIYCTTPECGFMRHSFNNGDTDENAALRLTMAWNRRPRSGNTERQ